MSGEDVDFAEFNTHIRDNFNVTAPGIATAAGRLIVTSGANSIVERIPATAQVATTETTASATYTDLATSGPAVTVATGTMALVIVRSAMRNNTAGQSASISVAVSGATTIAADDLYGATTAVLNLFQSFGNGTLFTTLTAGSNTFTMKYVVSGGTGTFLDRGIIVIPF